MRWLPPPTPTWFLVAVVVPVLVACQVESTVTRYEFALTVHSDPGEPLAGARVSSGKATLAESDESGRATVTTTGTEGARVHFKVECPEGYRSPDAPVSAILRRLPAGARPPEFRVECPPTKRKLVIAVRAENGANLPVMHLGQEVAKTDSSGAAHVALESAPQESIRLILDTSSVPKLRPQNPSIDFEVPDHDELLTFEQKFTLPQAKRRVFYRAPRKPRGPVRLTPE